MKKQIIIALATLLVVLFWIWVIWIPKETDHYIYVNSIDTVVSVELLSNQNHDGQGTDWDYIYSIRFLSEDEIQPFIERVRQIPTSDCYPPFSGWGSYIAKVTYSNGDVELLGSHNIEYIAKGKDYFGYSFYYYVGDEFKQLFEQYIDAGKYPFYS